MIYILIAIILFVACWPLLRPYVARWMQHRTEDTLRRMMGMPSRKEEQKARKQAEKRTRNASSRGARKSGRRYPGSGYGHIIPPEYAEDVEYTEYKEYSHTHTDINTDIGSYMESQVEDVEYKEVRTNNKSPSTKKC